MAKETFDFLEVEKRSVAPRFWTNISQSLVYIGGRGGHIFAEMPSTTRYAAFMWLKFTVWQPFIKYENWQTFCVFRKRLLSNFLHATVFLVVHRGACLYRKRLTLTNLKIPEKKKCEDGRLVFAKAKQQKLTNVALHFLSRHGQTNIQLFEGRQPPWGTQGFE